MTVTGQTFSDKYLYSSVLLLLMALSFHAKSQPPALHPPLEGELLVSGTFGEVRGSHFHTGMDFKTGNKIGLPVHCVEEGEVVRVKVESGGYGKAIYVRHPDGITSVYAHLSEFTQPIASWVKEQQYAKKEFEVDLYPTGGKFIFNRGEQIGKSGNSGGSGAPHLHFELRETRTGQPINPSRYGFDVQDSRVPELKKLLIYEHFGKGAIEDALNAKKIIGIEKNGSGWKADQVTIAAAGPISFGMGTLDRLSGAENPCGIYSIDLKVNGELFHSFRFDQLDFATKRLVNTHVDYRFKKEEKVVVHRTYRSPTNVLGIYMAGRLSRGILNVEKGKTYDLEYTVMDHYGNTSTLEFEVRGEEIIPSSKSVNDVVKTFYPDNLNSYSDESFKFSTPKAAVYDTLGFRLKKNAPKKNCLAPVYSVCDLETPLNKYCSISIRMEGLGNLSTDKLLIISYDSKGEPIAEGGQFKDGWVTSNTRSFGDYSVMIDSVKPTIEALTNLGDLQIGDTLSFKVEDDLAGIADLHATLNGKWVLLEWDPKEDHAFWVVDDRLDPVTNFLVLRVLDEVGNQQQIQQMIHRGW